MGQFLISKLYLFHCIVLCELYFSSSLLFHLQGHSEEVERSYQFSSYNYLKKLRQTFLSGKIFFPINAVSCWFAWKLHILCSPPAAIQMTNMSHMLLCLHLHLVYLCILMDISHLFKNLWTGFTEPFLDDFPCLSCSWIVCNQVPRNHHRCNLAVV